MSVEHQPTPEKAAAETHELVGRREQAEVHHQSTEEKEQAVEKARHKIEDVAPELKPHTSNKEAHRPPPSRQEKKQLYKHTLSQIQRDLGSPASKVFSKIIHQPIIEKTSEVAAKTIFRPSLTLGASLGALVGGTLTYLIARRYGFELPRSHFLVYGLWGALLGLMLEGLRALWRNRSKRS